MLLFSCYLPIAGLPDRTGNVLLCLGRILGHTSMLHSSPHFSRKFQFLFLNVLNSVSYWHTPLDSRYLIRIGWHKPDDHSGHCHMSAFVNNCDSCISLALPYTYDIQYSLYLLSIRRILKFGRTCSTWRLKVYGHTVQAVSKRINAVSIRISAVCYTVNGVRRMISTQNRML